MTKPLVAKIYNPQNQDREQLIDSFVVRIKLFKRLFKEISTADMKYPEQHYLILGKRGMGKTTLLLRLAYEVEKKRKLNKWLIPLVFNEEEYGIRKLYKFWSRVADLLESKNDAFLGLSEQIENMSAEFDNDDEYEKAIFELIEQAIQKEKKKIILFIDNVGDIFSKFSDKEAHRLRKILQTSSDFRIFAGSSKDIDAFHDYKHPFYEFFKAVRLEGLNQKETETMMLKLAEFYNQTERIEYIIENQKGRLEAMRRLTGGVIRTIVLLFEIFVDSKDGTAFTDLDAILDRVTPLYKHRTDDLSAQQQEILEAVAFAWDAVSVKEIKQKTRMESKMISAQINTLVKNHVVARIPTTTKNHFYQIDERFYNIWYLMRYGKKGQKDKVLWLIRFLEEWCDEKAIIERAKQQIMSLSGGKYDERAAYFIAQAIAATKHLPNIEQDQLLKKTKDYLKNRKSEYAEYVCDSELDLFDRIINFFKNEDYKSAHTHIKKLKIKNDFLLGYLFQFGDKNIEEGISYFSRYNIEDFKVTFLLGLIEMQKASFSEAEKKFIISLDLIIEKKYYGLLKHVLVLFNFANALKVSVFLRKQIIEINSMLNIKTDLDFNIIKEPLSNKNVLYYSQLILDLFIEESRKDISINNMFLTIDVNEDFALILTEALIRLLSLEKFELVESILNYFQDVEMKLNLKPIYFSLRYYQENEYPNEYLRMGSELKETVNEIIERVEEAKKRK